MLGTQFPSHHHDSVNTTRLTYLEILPQSADRAVSPLRPRSPRSALSPSPDPGRRRNRKRDKSVHWDPSVVDNEHKMQSRPKKSTATVHLSEPHVASAKPSQHAASSKSPTANTSAKMDSSHSRQPSDYNFMQSRQPLSPVYPERSRAPAHQPSQYPGANSSSKMVPSRRKKSPTKVKKALPAVPDPPRAHRPPPAPRPARLPTPDLPEIDEAKFFIPKDEIFDFSHGRSDPRGRPVHQKIANQLETAMAYIQERKRSGN